MGESLTGFIVFSVIDKYKDINSKHHINPSHFVICKLNNHLSQ